MKEGALRLATDDGLELEARWDTGDAPIMAVVFSHPHPRHGGTMTAPLMEKVTAELVGAGMAVLRFNFRGVGASDGSWGEGVEELRDIAAAMDEASGAGLRVGLSGWSFGAAMALRWQAATGDTTVYCGISPPVADLPSSADLAAAERTIIMGERDQLIHFEASKAYAASIDARFIPMSADHFFYYREARVAAHVVDSLGGF